MVKNPPANAGDARDELDHWVGKIPWSRKLQPTPVFLPRASQGQRNLAGYSPWDCKESDMTEQPQSSLDIHVAIIRSVRATIVANLLQFPYLANCSLNYSTECWREHFSNRPTSAVIKGLRFQDLKVRHSE